MRRVDSLTTLSIWLLHLALPLIGLWLLITQPQMDGMWKHEQSHFWLVALVAVVNVILGALVSEAARQRADARLFLVSLGFVSSAGFLLLHALATPRVLLPSANAGFTIATPVGLVLAAGFAAASALDLSEQQAAALLRRQGALRGAVSLVLLAWALVSLFNLPPLNRSLDADVSGRWLLGMAILGVGLYVFATVRYYQLYLRRQSLMLIGISTAFALLAESLVAVAVARNWHASWWEWHLLMTAGFACVAASAAVHYQREGSRSGLFQGMYLDQTVKQIQQEYSNALETLVQAVRQRAEPGASLPIAQVTAQLRQQFQLSEGQTAVLEQAAEALANERQQLRRLAALVAVGQETSVIVDELGLLRRVLALTRDTFAPDMLRIATLRNEQLHFFAELGSAPSSGSQPATLYPADARTALLALEPAEVGTADSTLLALPLAVKGQLIGVLEARRTHGPFADRDRWLLRSLASQLSTAIENARLYRQLDGLFRQYMAPSVATALIANPAQAELGGALADVTVLFADLQGYTAFSEHRQPEAVVAMLNQYFGAAAPLVLAQGGTIDKFVGDAMMALFNVPVRQPDHALRAVRAALAMQRAVNEIAATHTGWPHFRIGIHSGPAVVGNIGSAELRNYTAVGDTINVAARLQASAERGQIVLGAATYALVREAVVVEPLDPLQVKGKTAPLEAYLLLGMGEG